MLRQDLVDGRAQPGGRAPAPGRLRLVQDLVNTVDRENGVELLDGPAGLRAWLDHRGLAPGATVADRDVRQALALREALRTLLHANAGTRRASAEGARGATDPASARATARTGGPGDLAAARATLEATAGRARLRATFGADGAATLAPSAPGVAGALGTVVAAAHAAMAAGEWHRLKACPREVCGWAFHDRSPNNGATWCSMRVCGNRTKAAAYHRRRVSGSRAGGRTP